MINIVTHFRHFIKPTEEIEEYVRKKISKLTQYNKDIMEVHIDIDAGKERTSYTKYRASVTLHLPPKHILHAEAAGKTPQAAIDLVHEELEREIKKHDHNKRLSHKERNERKTIGRFTEEEEEL